MSSLLTRPNPHSDRWLDEHAHEWAKRGILTDEQVDAILRAESVLEVPAAAPSGLGLPAEVVAYLGSLLALVGGAVMVSRTWDQLAWPVRLAIGAVVAVVGFVGGTMVRRLSGPSAERLGGFLWTIGAGGVALATAIASFELVSDDAGVTATIVGPVVLVIGLALWRNLDRPLQLLTAVGGLVATMAGVGSMLDVSAWPYGIALWASAALFGLLALVDRVRPQWLSLVIGAVGMLIGASMLADLEQHVSMFVGLATATLIVTVGLATHRVPVTVIGVIGFLSNLAAVLGTYLTGPLAAALVLLLGLVLVVVVLMRSTRQARPAG